MRYLVLTLCVLSLSCGPDAAGGGATPEAASVVIQGLRANTDDDTVERYPACMGVAVSPTTILTAAHCEPSGADGAFSFVDYPTWNRTSAGFALADLAFDAGEVRALVPRQPLLNWATPGRSLPGPAEFIVLRGTGFAVVPTELDGYDMTGDVQHGDSGAGVFQRGLLVGLVQACTAPDDMTCIGGGRFSGVP